MKQVQIDVVTVGSTSQTLAELLDAIDKALPRWTVFVMLVPHSSGIYMDDDTASAADEPLGIRTIPGTPETLSALEFYAASNTNMTVYASDEPLTADNSMEIAGALGSPTDAPVAYNGDDEGATARSHTSLLKRIANALKAACASLASIVTNQTALKKAVGFKMVLGSGGVKTCTNATTNYEITGLTAGGFYNLTNTSTTAVLQIGEADTATAANILLSLTPGMCQRYEIQGTSLHVQSSVAGANLRYAKVDIS